MTASLISCPRACSGQLTDGTLCPGTLRFDGGTREGERYVREGCPEGEVRIVRKEAQQ